MWSFDEVLFFIYFFKFWKISLFHKMKKVLQFSWEDTVLKSEQNRKRAGHSWHCSTTPPWDHSESHIRATQTLCNTQATEPDYRAHAAEPHEVREGEDTTGNEEHRPKSGPLSSAYLSFLITGE